MYGTQVGILADGTMRAFPVAWIHVDTPYYQGKVKASCTETPVFDLVLGNIPGVREPNDPDHSWTTRTPMEAEDIRTQEEIGREDICLEPWNGREGLINEQQQDGSLTPLRHLAETGKEHRSGNHVSSFSYQKGMLSRKFRSPKVEHGKLTTQVVVPQTLRTQIIKVAHESLMEGHLGVKKTVHRLQTQFYWPCMGSDVRRYCRSCNGCRPPVSTSDVRVPLGHNPIRLEHKNVVESQVSVSNKGNSYMRTFSSMLQRIVGLVHKFD